MITGISCSSSNMIKSTKTATHVMCVGVCVVLIPLGKIGYSSRSYRSLHLPSGYSPCIEVSVDYTSFFSQSIDYIPRSKGNSS